MNRLSNQDFSWAFVFLLILGLSNLASAEKQGTDRLRTASQKTPPKVGTLAVTHHFLRIGERKLTYTVTAGTFPIPVDSSSPRERIFYVGYQVNDTGTTHRPVTFVFNGGPGAASAYLHMGALGPKRVVFNDDGSVPPPPAQLIENSFTWLTFTDLVFVDPIGTGFSHIMQDREARKKATEKELNAEFWGTQKDVTSIAEFIRLYLTRNERWLSPIFLVGESYGGFRVAALSESLTSKFGIGVNGLVLISPVLEFSLQIGDNYRVLPWSLLLPSYAATAFSHGKAGISVLSGSDISTALREVESFSLNDLLSALAQGDGSEKTERKVLYEKLSRYTGLPFDLIQHLRGRIPREVFVKELLRKAEKVVDMYDGSIAGIDPDPNIPVFLGDFPTLDRVSQRISAAFNSYVREDLKFKTDFPYLLLNRKVFTGWKWLGGGKRSQGFAGETENLKTAMTLNPHLRVFIAHGYFDLVTPYFASIFAVKHMELDEAVRSNIVLKVYSGGHMVYTHSAAREQLYHDVKIFYQNIVR